MKEQLKGEDEVSLIDIVKRGLSILQVIKREWIILMLCVLLASTYMWYKASIAPIQYPAVLTFMVNENEGGGLGAAGGILGSLGLGGDTGYNLDKIVELARSNRIINQTLLSTAVVNGKKDFLGNHIIDVYNLPNTKWRKDKILSQGFHFKTSNIDSFSTIEKKVLKRLHVFILGQDRSDALLLTSYKRSTTIMQLDFISESEDLTVAFLKELYHNLSEFYVKKAVEKQKFTYDVIIKKADSIKAVLNNREFSRAKFEDTNRGLFMETSKLPAQKYSRDVTMLNIMYSESVKNAEMADFAIKSKIPFVQSIDIPFAPLSAKEVSKFKNIQLGIGIGLVLGLILIYMKHLYSVLKSK